MSKISLLGRSLQFIESLEYAKTENNMHIFQYKEKQNMLALITLIENHPNPDKDQFFILSEDSKRTEKKFISYFKIIEAAGGVVKNKKSELLLIFRNGKWDLPKGKVEVAESIEKAALREVSEECGIHKIKIVRPLECTYHTYQLKDKRILKKTYWYEMQSDGDEPLIPQIEEGITDLKWMNAESYQKALENSYETVHDVISAVNLEPGN